MKTTTGGIISAAFLLLTSVVYAGHPAPGVQIIVNKGGATVFKAITDTTGQFSTDSLEPGEYQFEVRGPKVVPPVRYFLVLGGARPVGETLTNANGDLAMQAQVRRPGSIRGQVSSSRIIMLPGVATSPTSSPSVVGTSSSSLNNARATSQTAAAGQRQPTAFIGSSNPPATSTSLAAATLANPSAPPAVRARANPPQSRAAATPSVPAGNSTPHPPQTTAASTLSTAGTPAAQSKMIGGKRYHWVPTAPGSTVGRWVLDTPQTSQSAPAASARPPAQNSSQGTR